jgi:hypothetical protein
MNKRLSAAVFSLNLLVAEAGFPASATQTGIQQLLQKAGHLKIGSSRAWKKLLFISDKIPSWPQRPVIDDPTFILTDGGWVSAEKELQATLEAFSTDRSILIDGEMQPSRCIFAARYAFLDTHLNLQEAGIRKPDCQKLLDFQTYTQYSGASLVFSNYYLNNPSSMFGHTFLRLHRGGDARYGSIPLLDDAINYAAQVSNPHDPLYPIKGLSGFYRGRWAMLPYYSKVQEYSNFESRDLYEYSLHLTAEDLQRLSLLLWEQGAFYSHYYFLSENCSYHILLLLEAVRPDLHLTDKLGISVIPIDSLHALADAGVLDQMHVRPSLLTRLEERFSQLDKNARDDLESMIENRHALPAVKARSCDAACRAAALDVFIEWQEYHNKSAGAIGAKEIQDERRQVLLARADLKVPSEPLTIGRSFAPPHEAHRTTTFGVLARQSSEGPGAILRLRPALHDPISRVDGYGPGMGISFLDSYFSLADKKKPVLSKLDLLEITSIPHTNALWRPWAWYFHTGYRDQRRDTKACLQLDSCRNIDLGFAIGPQLRISSALSTYALLGGKVFYDMDRQRTLGRPQGVLALLYQSDRFALQAQARPEVHQNGGVLTPASLGVSYTMNRATELRLRAESIGNWSAVEGGLLYFF